MKTIDKKTKKVKKNLKIYLKKGNTKPTESKCQ